MTASTQPALAHRNGRRPGLAAFAGLNAVAAWGGAFGLGMGALSFGDALDHRLPFHSPVLAGVALAFVVALPLTRLSLAAWRGEPETDRMLVVVGFVLLAWIAVQIVVLRAFSFFQPFYAAVGVGFVRSGRRTTR